MRTIHSFFSEAVAEYNKTVELPHGYTAVWQDKGISVACQKKGKKMQLVVYLRCGLYSTASEHFWRDDEQTPAKTLASICVAAKHLQQATWEMSELARTLQAACNAGFAVVSVERFGPNSDGTNLKIFNSSAFVIDLPKSYSRRTVRKTTQQLQSLPGNEKVLCKGQVTSDELALMRRASAAVDEQQLLRHVMDQKWSAELSNDQLIAVTADALQSIDNTGQSLEQALDYARKTLT